MTLIERLTQLHEQATPGPLSVETDSCDCGEGYGCNHGQWCHAIHGQSIDSYYKGRWTELCEIDLSTVHLFVALRNALPALIAYCKAAREMSESVDTHDDHAGALADCPKCARASRNYRAAQSALLAALNGGENA